MNKVLKIFCLVIVVLLGGCVTRGEVKDLLYQSNMAIVGNAGSELTPGVDPDADWQLQVERIERFIAENPDMTITNQTLRIREGVVLMMAGRINLARSVFSQVDCDGFEGNERDRLICTASDPLLFWYGVDADGGLADSQVGDAKDALEALADVADPLATDSPTRRLLEHIHVLLADLVSVKERCEFATATASNALQRYGATFDSSDQAIIQKWAAGKDVDISALPSLRWFDHVPNAFNTAQEQIGDPCRVQLVPDWIACIDDESCPSLQPDAN